MPSMEEILENSKNRYLCIGIFHYNFGGHLVI